MADIDEPEVDELVEEEEIEEVEQAEEAQEDDGPLVVSFGDDEPEEPDFSGPAPEWVKEVRKQNNELKKRLRELEAAKAPALDIGPKPTLEDCDFEPEVFEQRLQDWFARKQEVDTVKQAEEANARAAEEAFQTKVAAYNKAKTELPVDDFDDAESVVIETFNEMQQGLLVKVAKQPAVLAYALGKHPTKAKALAAIKDPVDFIAAAVRMEAEMKQGKRTPAPERVIGGGGVAGSTPVDNQLEALRAEAAKTGDMSKVLRYRASMRRGG